MEDKQRPMTLIFWNVLLPLLLGTAIYVLWNPDTYIGTFVSRLVGIRNPWRPEKLWNSPINLWIKYYAADMAWAYAFAFSICLAAGMERKTRGVCFAACILMEILFEAAQYVHVISGYFDWMDIGVELVMNFCAYLAWKYNMKKHLKGGKATNEKEIS